MHAKAHLELVQQLLNDLVCGHPAGDAHFSWCAEGWGEDGGLWRRLVSDSPGESVG